MFAGPWAGPDGFFLLLAMENHLVGVASSVLRAPDSWSDPGHLGMGPSPPSRSWRRDGSGRRVGDASMVIPTTALRA